MTAIKKQQFGDSHLRTIILRQQFEDNHLETAIVGQANSICSLSPTATTTTTPPATQH